MKHVVAVFALSLFACTVGGSSDDDLIEADEEQDPPQMILAAGYGPCVKPAITTTGTAVTLGGKPAWVHFTNPVTGAPSKQNITDEVVRLIWSVPAGGTIHAAIHSLALDNVAQALICAQKMNQVTVRVVEDGGIATPRKDISNAAWQLENALGNNLTYCGQGTDHQWSCIQKGKKAIMHTKLFLFSTATAPDGAVASNVVWVGSANMTKATGQNTFNNTVTIYGDSGLYDGALKYYRDLQAKHDSPSDDYFHDRGRIDTASARLFLSPSPATDLWKDRLDQIVPGADCGIAVAHAYIMDARSAVVQKLRTLANKGCTVMVIGPKKDTPEEQANQFSPSMLAILNGDPAHGIPKIPTKIAKIHEKYMLVHARYGDQPNTVRDFVFTGSHNLTGPANSRNDELLARLDGASVMAPYFAHFLETWAAGDAVN